MTPTDSLVALVLKTCPQDSTNITLRAELDDGWSQLDLRYRSASGDEAMSDLPNGSGIEIHMLLDEAREEMARASGCRWTSCDLEIEADGRFRLNVQYPE